MQMHREIQSDTQLSMTDIHPVIKTAMLFSIDRKSLLDIVHDYIKNLNREIYLIRLTQLCPRYAHAIGQSIHETVEHCAERYHALPEVLYSGFVFNRFIVFYSEYPQ